MRLYGALKPHGASIRYNGSSNGAMYHDKDSILNKNNKSSSIISVSKNTNINYLNKDHKRISSSSSSSSNNSNSSNITNNIIKRKNCNRNITIKIENCNNTKIYNNYKNYFISYTSLIMMRIQQSFNFYLLFIICSLYVFSLLPHTVYCDDNENGFFVNGFSMEPEITTPEFGKY